MSRSLLFLALSLAGAPILAQEPSREDLLATVRHITSLSKELQHDLDEERQHELETGRSLALATSELTITTSALRDLQRKTDTLAEHSASVELKAARQQGTIRILLVIIGLQLLLMGLYAFLKFYLRVPFL